MMTTNIALLSLLIAMMGNTYERIFTKSEKEWKKQVFLLIFQKTAEPLQNGSKSSRYKVFITESSV